MRPKQLQVLVEAPEEVADLLLQTLETEMGDADVYRTALTCVHNERLHAEWSGYLAQAEKHVRILQEACERLGIDTALETPGRRVVRNTGRALVQSMLLALDAAPPDSLEAIVSDCVALAGTKDPSSWGALQQGKAHEPLEREDWSRTAWLPQVEPLDADRPRPLDDLYRADVG